MRADHHRAFAGALEPSYLFCMSTPRAASGAPAGASPSLDRRAFLGALGAFGVGAAMSGCGSDASLFTSPSGGNARLVARPVPPTQLAGPGSFALTEGNANDGALVVPAGLTAPAPLVVVLHGATMGAAWSLATFTPIAQSRRFVLLAPGARGLTWDVMTYKYDYDVAFIDRALAFTFQRVAIDPARILVLGFSDGATYALGLGAANGDWIPRIAACSPGYVPRSDSPRAGASQYFVSHGRQDTVLPIERTSRVIVPALRQAGYTVRFEEFDGGHGIPPAILDAVWGWAGV